MTAMQRAALLRDHRVWLAVLALVLLVRFPVKFALERPYLMDFDVYQTAAQWLIHGEGRQLYTAPATSELMYFKYGPAWAVAWAGLAFVSNHAGAVLWSLGALAWLLLLCVVSRRLCRAAGLQVPACTDVAVVLFLVRPLTAEFLNGQVDLLWGLLVTLGLAGTVFHHPWASAAAWAGAISLKLPAALVLPYLALRRQWAAVGRLGVCLLLLNDVGAWLVAPQAPLELLLEWARLLRDTGSARAFEIGTQSLLALLGRYLTADGYRLNLVALPRPALLLLWAALQIGLFGLLFVGRPSRAGEPRRTLLDGALLTVCMVLFAPTCWLATYSTLVWPVFLSVALWASQPPEACRSIPLIVSGVLAGAASALTHAKLWRWLGVASLRGESYVYLVVMTLPWMGLALFAHLWWSRACLSKNPNTTGRPSSS